jgi:hypothetical protein
LDEKLLLPILFTILVLACVALWMLPMKRRCRRCGAWFTVGVRWFTIGLKTGRTGTRIFECERCGYRYEEGT